MYRIAKPINGISLNGNEFLLDDSGKVMEFKNRDDAVNMLMEKTGLSENDAWENDTISIWDMEENKCGS